MLRLDAEFDCGIMPEDKVSIWDSAPEYIVINTNENNVYLTREVSLDLVPASK